MLRHNPSCLALLPIRHFTITYLLMEAGLIIRVMAMSGVRRWMVISDLMPPMAIGFILMKDGHGNQIIPGAGRPFIMAAGYMMICMDGYGCRVMIGLLPG